MSPTISYAVFGSKKKSYPNLHAIRKVDGEPMIPTVQFADKDPYFITLESYSDDHHGFLRVEVTPTTLTGRYYVVPRPQDPFSKGSHLVDYFEFDWATKK